MREQEGKQRAPNAGARSTAEKALRDFADALAAIEKRLQTSAKAEAGAAPGSVDRLRAKARSLGGLPQTGAPDNPLAGLTPAAMHKLEKADGHVRHSIVKACLYNLRTAVDALPNRWEDEAFVAGLRRHLDEAPTVRKVVDALLRMPLDGGSTLAKLCPGENRRIENALDRLERLAGRHPATSLSQSTARALADDIRKTIDEVTAGLEGITRHIRRRKLALSEIVTDALGLVSEKCEEKQVKLFFNDETGGAAKTFVAREELLNALVELIENALKYAFVAGTESRRIDVTLSYADENKLDARITVADNGAGIAENVLAGIGRRGVTTGGTGEGLAMVKFVVESVHLGGFNMANRASGGAEATILLPIVLRV